MESGNLSAALQSLHDLVATRQIIMSKCDLADGLYRHFDHPEGHPERLTYARLERRQVLAMAVFVSKEHMFGLPCKELGYAVMPKFQRQGVGTGLVRDAIEDLRRSFNRGGVGDFWIKAIIEKDNKPSNRIASAILGSHFSEKTDERTGIASNHYQRLYTSGAATGG